MTTPPGPATPSDPSPTPGLARATVGFLADLLAGRRTAVLGAGAEEAVTALTAVPGERVVDATDPDERFEAVLVVEPEPTRQRDTAATAARRAADGAVVVVWRTNTAPLIDGPTGPVGDAGPPVSTAALREAGLGPLRSYASYAGGRVVAAETVLGADHVGGPAATVIAGLLRDTGGVTEESLRRLTLAGALSAAADGWWSVAGGGARALHTDGFVADLRPGHGRWTITGAAGRAWTLPVGPSVEEQARVAERDHDLPALRALAGALGRFCSGPERPVRPVGWELLFGGPDQADTDHPSGLIALDPATGEPVPSVGDPGAADDADATERDDRPRTEDGADDQDRSAEVPTVGVDDPAATALVTGWRGHLRRRAHRTAGRAADDLWSADRSGTDVLVALLTWSGVADPERVAADADRTDGDRGATTGKGDGGASPEGSSGELEVLRHRVAAAEDLTERYRQQLTHRERHIHDLRHRWIEQEARAEEAEGQLKRITTSRAWRAVQVARFLRTVRRPRVFVRESAGHARSAVRLLRRRLMNR